MNKFAALSALVLLVQVINASPVIENNGKSLLINKLDIKVYLLNYSWCQTIIEIALSI